jgi:hypothetical protein
MDTYAKYNAVNALKTKYNLDIWVLYNKYNNLINLATKNYLRNRNVVIRNYIRNYNLDVAVLLDKYKSDVNYINNANIPSVSTLRKKALLIGINYPNTEFPLDGCVNDINKMGTILVEKFGFQSVVKLHDTSSIFPTKTNILAQLTLLLSQSKSGDVLFFHYSGHGSQIKDTNGDDADGLDEVIIPSDYFSNKSIITDDEIKAIVQANLKEGVKLFVLMDCCHSGTIFDLKYNYDTNWNPVVNDKSLDTIGDVIVISGCSDPQVSFDTKINNLYQGTTTWTFTSSVNSTITWKQMINNMRQMLIKANLSEQVPQISTGKPFDINAVVVI